MYIPFKIGDFPAITLVGIGIIFLYVGTNSTAAMYIGFLEIILGIIQYFVARDYIDAGFNNIKSIKND